MHLSGESRLHAYTCTLVSVAVGASTEATGKGQPKARMGPACVSVTQLLLVIQQRGYLS
jgi:hypothetical protein